MLDHGMRATVNSDDPAHFPGYMNENLAAAQAEAGMTREEVVQLARQQRSVSAWLEGGERAPARPARRCRRRLAQPRGRPNCGVC